MANILIIEDNLMNLEIAQELLQNDGHEVISSESAQDGILLARSKAPDLILMDLSLPEMDGLTATKALKQDPLTKNIPIVAFTAMIMANDKEKAIRAGCSGFITKPIEINTFSDTVEKYLPAKFKQSLTNNVSALFNPYAQEGQNFPSLIDKTKWHKILVVDDNSMNAEILKEILEQINQTPIIAYNAVQALELIEKNHFDLILLDVMMPEMSGFELMQKLKESPKSYQIPVIFISALNETADITKGLDLGSYGYITKPFNIEEVKSRILSVLRIKDLQDDLKSEKTKLDLIFEFSADGIVMINSKFEIISCNPLFCQWFDMQEQELTGKNFFKLINNNEQASLEDEVILLRNGKTIILQVHYSKIKNIKENTEGYVLILRDISAYREIENQKETFVATLTHDLKTPIRAEANALKLLLKGTFGELNNSQKEIIGETLNSSKYMLNMVDNLLSTYRYDNGNVKIVLEKNNLNDIITESFNELKYLFEDKKQKVLFNLTQFPINLMLDSIEIKRVIINFLSNANKYTQNEGEITIISGINQQNAFVSVQDNGKGIAEADLSKLFSKYITYAHQFKEVGTGLGLYLSKKIIEKHNGNIFVESKINEGSKFTFTLPLM